MLLKLERRYNHVADIGALCNDVRFGLAQAWTLTPRERLLQLDGEVTGHRRVPHRIGTVGQTRCAHFFYPHPIAGASTPRGHAVAIQDRSDTAPALLSRGLPSGLANVQTIIEIPQS